MSHQQYERVPLVENGVPLEQLDPSYFTGIPNTAPPSFRSVASSNSHRRASSQQSTAVERDENTEDQGISLWGGSSMDAESVRENAITLLMNRLDALESRLEEQPLVGSTITSPLTTWINRLQASKEVDLKSLAEQKRRELWIIIGLTIAVIIFSLWIMAVTLLSVWARVENARHAGQLKADPM